MKKTVKAENMKTGRIARESSDLVNIQGTGIYNATITLDVAGTDYLHVYVDPDNQVEDETANDNYVLMPFVQKKLKANLSINTGFPLVDAAIKDYLKFYIDDVSSSQTSLIIAIGKNTSEQWQHNAKTLSLKSNPFGVISSQLKVNTAKVSKPYSGLIGTYSNSSKKIVFIYGNRIEGDIAALKEFISARSVFFSFLDSIHEPRVNKNLVIVDDYDINAIGVFDLMHNNESASYFGAKDTNADKFAEIVTDILNDNNFEISIKTVKTVNDNTTLRLKHANTGYSRDFQDAAVGNPQPVVLSHGIHSDLFTWNDFAEKLAKNGRDAWLIEMYGGPTTECDTCPVYTFNDLRSYYWPALVAGVQHYSGQNNLAYVGYDLGCTVALESLENYSSGANSIGYYFDTVTGDYNFAEPMDLSASSLTT